jgi:hypothetical protein
MAALFGKLLFSGVGLLFSLFGVGIIWFGRKVGTEARAMEAEKRTPAADVAPGGQVEVHGTARPADEGPVETPLYGWDALDAVTSVQERAGRPGAGSGWRTLQQEHSHVPFVVTDEGGEVRVDPPADANPVVRMEWEGFGAGAEASDHARECVADTEAADPDVGIDVGPVTTGRRQRCGEGAIRPGDEVVVFGQAVERPGDWGETDVVITGGEDETFIASELDEAEITGTVTKVTIAIYAFGVVWTLATLVGALSPWLF